jgi:alpha-L-fucosidase
VLTSKHHDGFALWPSEQANQAWGRKWNSVDNGPHRDLVGDLSAAVRDRGLKMGLYYSLYEWYNPLWLADRKNYAVQHMAPQFKDVVTRYKPSLIFADGEWDMTSAEWKSPELLAWLFNDSPSRDDVVINDRWGKDSRHKHGGYFTTEYTAGLEGTDRPWEEDRGMGFSFGYNRAEQLKDYRTPRELVLMLVDLVSRGGNLLLDIGPAADGTIPLIMEERLLQIGAWLGVNGEAIYGTRPWKRTRQWSSGEVPELKQSTFRVRYEIDDYVSHPKPGQAVIEAFFTAKGNDVYAIVPRRPGKTLLLKGITASGVSLLGGGALKYRSTAGNLEIEMPETMAASDAYVVKLSGAH